MNKLKKNPKPLFLAKETLAVIGGAVLYGNQINPIDSSGTGACEPTAASTT